MNEHCNINCRLNSCLS